MNVVYAATRNLYPYLQVAIGTLLEHNDAEVYVIAEDDSVGLDVHVINVSDQTYYKKDGPNMNSIFTYMAMMRLLYVDLLPDLDKVLQLDVDTIVCDTLLPLWETNIKGKWFAAVPEYKGTYKPFGVYNRYYNIGVTLFNLEQLRIDGKVHDMVDYLNRHKLWCTEQDVLNLYVLDNGKAVPLPTRYNETPFTDISDNPAIVHYAGEPNWFEANRNMKRVEYLLEARKKFNRIV